MGDIGKYIVIGGAVLIVAVIFLVIIKTRNGFVVLQNRVKNQRRLTYSLSGAMT